MDVERASHCRCAMGEGAWGRQGWHMSLLTPYLADRWARENHPHDETAREQFKELLVDYVGTIEVAYERCPAYLNAIARSKS